MSEPEETHKPKVNLQRWLPLAVFLFAFGIRLIGVGWGLPNNLHNQSYHPDETVNWSYAQQIEPTKLDFTPGSYSYGTLYLTLLRVASDVVGGYGGGIDERDPGSLWRYIGSSLLAGRLLNVLFGALSALIVFWILRRWAGDLPSFLGAAVVAFAPGFVVHSRFATVDVLATLLILCSTYYALRLVPTEEEAPPTERMVLKLSMLSGLMAGLSAGTKYTGVLAVLSLLAALGLSHRDRFWLLAMAGLGAAAVGFVVATPGSLLETQKFVEGFKFEMQHAAAGHGMVFLGKGSAFVVHLLNLVEGVGGLILVLALLGLVGTPRPARRALLVLAAFALPYYFVIGRSEIMFMRYTFPLLPFLAFGLTMLMVRAGQKSLGRQKAATAAAILAVGGVPFWGGLRAAAVYTSYMAGEDPRDTAARFLKEEIAKDPATAVGIVADPWFYTPPLFPDTGLPRPMYVADKANVLEEARAAGLLKYIPGPSQEPEYDFDRRMLSYFKPKYVAISSFEAQDVERLRNLMNLPDDVFQRVYDYEDFMDLLKNDYEPYRMFGGGMPSVHDLEYIRPWIAVWKRKAAP